MARRRITLLILALFGAALTACTNPTGPSAGCGVAQGGHTCE